MGKIKEKYSLCGLIRYLDRFAVNPVWPRVSTWTISMWEKGLRKPEFETQDRLADFFHVKLAYLLGESDDDTAPAEPTDEEAVRWIQEESVDELLDYVRQFLRLDYNQERF